MTASGIGGGCEPMRFSLGAYVLGALSAEESRELLRHLADCGGCRREHEDMTGVPSVLGLLSRTEAEAVVAGWAPAGGPAAAWPGEQSAAPRRQQRRGLRRRSRRRRLVAVAAALAVLAGGGAAWTVIEARQQPAAAVVVASAVDPTTGVGASISVQRVLWGSRLTLALHNAPRGSACSLVAVGRNGERQVAASWSAQAGGNLTIPGAVAMAPGDISKFDVETFDGRMLVSVPE